MPAAVHEYIDAPPTRHDLVDQTLDVVVRLVRPRNADAAEFFRQRLALSGRRENADLEAIGREPASAPMPLPPAVTTATFVSAMHFPSRS